MFHCLGNYRKLLVPLLNSPESISKDVENNAYKTGGEQPIEGC